MKNLKKAFAVVVALAMVMSTVAFAAVFSDVDDSAAYAEAIEAGVALKMFTGYEDGTFKPEGDITRAEFAAIVVRMLGQEAQADGAKGVTLFDDVPSTHWAAGYINIVSNLGIVNGYGDGNFGPEDNVTYEQAVKMCVVALGYEPAAGGNYPVGYLTIAQQRGITTGVRGTSGAPINRGQVAQMAFNALDVPLMTQTGFGTYIEYVINDGTNNTDRKTLLSENLGIVKVKAIVTESYELSSVKKADLVQLEITNNYKTPYEDEFEEGTTRDVYVGDTNIRSLVGYPVIAYLAYDEMSDDATAMYVRKDFTSTEELTLAISDIEEIKEVTSGGNVSYYQISYYPTADARTTEKFTVRAEPNIYVNGDKESKDILTVLDPEDYYGTATFALGNSTDTSEDYDTIYILSYRNAVVESVDTKAGRVDMKEGDPISFGSNKTNVSSTLYDEDGNEIDWSTLQENDILSIRTAKGTVTVNICTLVRNTVEGTITERSSETDEYMVEFGIGGEYYKVDNQLVVPDDLDLNYEGVFYLDIFGRIAHYEAQSSLTRNYAYVINTGIHDAGFEDRLQIKAFTFDGEVVTFTCAQNVTVIKEKAGKTSTESVYFKKDDMDDLKDLIPVDSVITFSVNSQGEINRLALPGSNSDIGLNYFARYAQGDDFDYRGNSATIRVGGKSVEISDNTIIMIAGPGFSEDDYDLLSLSVLGAEDIFENVTTSVYDVDKNMVAGLVVVNGMIDVAGESAGLAVVAGITWEETGGGYYLTRLTLLQGGETKQVDVAEYCCVPYLYSVIRPYFNAKGMLTDYDVIAEANSWGVELGSGFAGSDYVQYAFGVPVDIRSNRVTLQYEDGNGSVTEELFSIPSAANVYLYDNRLSGSIPRAKVAQGINIFDLAGDTYYDGYGKEIDEVNILIRWYDGRIQDVVVYFYGEPSEPLREMNIAATGEAVYANAVYFNQQDAGINPLLVLARYDGGRLVETVCKNISIEPYSYGTAKGMMEGEFGNGDNIKAMLLDSWGNASPLINAREVYVHGLPEADDNGLTISSWDINDIQTGDYIRINYGNSESALLSTNAQVYVNGKESNTAPFAAISDFYGELELGFKNAGDIYTVAHIFDYSNSVVYSVDSASGRVDTQRGKAVRYGEGYIYSFARLYDVEGNLLDWSDLGKNDVISTRTVYDNNMTISVSTVSRQSVTGVITEKTPDGRFLIGGNYYKPDNQNVFADDLNQDDEGTFYLDIFGNIAYFEGNAALKNNYAYVIESDIDTVGFDNRLMLKAFTFEGEVEVFTCASRVILVEEADYGYGMVNTTYRDGGAEDFDDLEAKLPAGTVITFNVNEDGEVYKMALPGNSADIGLNFFSEYAQGSYFDYRGKNTDIPTLRVNNRSIEISENTVFMVADYTYFDDEDYCLLSPAVLGPQDIYKYSRTTVYNVDKNNVAGLVVVEGYIDIASDYAGLAMVTGISKQRDDDGAQIDVLTILRGGETSQIGVSEWGYTPDMFSIINPRLNAKGMLPGFDEVITINYQGAITTGNAFCDTNDVQYVIGTPVAISGNKVTLTGVAGSGEEIYEMLFSIPSTANIYLYDHSIRTNSLKAITVDSVNVFDVAGYDYYDENGDTIDSVQVLLRWYDGRVQDVFIFFNTELGY